MGIPLLAKDCVKIQGAKLAEWLGHWLDKTPADFSTIRDDKYH